MYILDQTLPDHLTWRVWSRRYSVANESKWVLEFQTQDGPKVAGFAKIFAGLGHKIAIRLDESDDLEPNESVWLPTDRADELPGQWTPAIPLGWRGY